MQVVVENDPLGNRDQDLLLGPGECPLSKAEPFVGNYAEEDDSFQREEKGSDRCPGPRRGSLPYPAEDHRPKRDLASDERDHLAGHRDHPTGTGLEPRTARNVRVDLLADVVRFGQPGEVSGEHPEDEEGGADDDANHADPLPLCFRHRVLLLLGAAPLYAAAVYRETTSGDQL